MSDLDTYLAKNYLNAEQFAATCEISTDEVAELIKGRLIPAPSYIVTESSTVRSHVFGEMEALGSTPGHYFHPANVVWVDIARRIISNPGHQSAYEELKERFVGNFQAALAELNATTWRLRDSFDDDGSSVADGLRARTDSAWEHFLHGTFGLCVANPISEAAIARKGVLQEKLGQLNENGFKAEFSQLETQVTLDLIDAYADSAMPFSPVEYHLSSRKRLVEDLRTRIKSAQQRVAADGA
jgi:hypothetical protein